MRDFEPIIIGATSPEVLIVHPSVPAKTVHELVTLVRTGKYNSFAIAGVGTPPHLSTELFKLSLKLNIVTVHLDLGSRIPNADTAIVRALITALPEAERQDVLLFKPPIASRFDENIP